MKENELKRKMKGNEWKRNVKENEWKRMSEFIPKEEKNKKNYWNTLELSW